MPTLMWIVVIASLAWMVYLVAIQPRKCKMCGCPTDDCYCF